MKPETPAVAYIRMSSGKQEASPEQQREEIAALAKRHGCRIIREYYDPGISGDDTKRRKKFQQMIRDAEERRDFAVILCWDQDRFGRFDSIEAGRWIYPLREAGVWLITVAQGQIDWNDFSSRMVYNVVQEGKHQFLLDLSKNVLRGKIAAARNGRGANNPPYGMDREFIDRTGAVVKRVPYGEKFTKPRDWLVRFVASNDAAAVETVRWIFEKFADSEAGVNWIASDLNRRNVQSPQGKAWSIQTVRGILDNRTYTGANVFGSESYGKYHRMGPAGEITRGNGAIKKGSPIVTPGVHDALISGAVFDRVQEKLAGRRHDNRRPRHNGYILSGVLNCGHCGGTMAGRTMKQQGEYRYYTCCTSATRPGQCKRYQIQQEAIEEYVLGVIEKRLLSDGAIEEIRAAVYRKAKEKRSHKGRTASLRAQIDALDKKIAKGTENLLLANPRDMAALSQLLEDWKQQRAALQADIERAAIAPGGYSPEKLAETAMTELRRLREHLKAADPAMVKGVVRSLVDEIRLWWEPYGKRNQRLASGVITFRSDLKVMLPGSRGR